MIQICNWKYKKSPTVLRQLLWFFSSSAAVYLFSKLTFKSWCLRFFNKMSIEGVQNIGCQKYGLSFLIWEINTAVNGTYINQRVITILLRLYFNNFRKLVYGWVLKVDHKYGVSFSISYSSWQLLMVINAIIIYSLCMRLYSTVILYWINVICIPSISFWV